LLQKTYCEDFLTKKICRNNGEIQQYYVEKSHPAIISPETFEIVQRELQLRKNGNGGRIFSSKIICGDCGHAYGAKTWHSTDKYKRVIWQCNGKYEGECKCSTPHLYETDIQQAFVNAYNTLISDKEQLLQDYEMIIGVLTDCTALDSETSELKTEISVVTELSRQLIDENARIALNQDEYQKQYAELLNRHETAVNRLSELENECQKRSVKRENISRFMTDISGREDVLTEFDEALFCSTVETITVTAEGNLIFKFRDGSEISV